MQPTERQHESPSIEEQKAQLLAAGWKEMRPRWMWKSPDGALWLGPHGAWKAMKAMESTNHQRAI